jgi:hypothetical protein
MRLSLPRLDLDLGLGLGTGLGRHLVGLMFLVTAAGACKSNPVGRKCFIGTTNQDAGTPQTIVASPALECQSRTCLHIAGRTDDLCTGECENDDDCQTSPESPCANGFVCMKPVVTGSFCCKKLCVCKDYVIIPDGGLIDPGACNADNPINDCCNLAGRRDNPTMYPGCRQ